MDKITAVGPGELQPAEIAHKLINAMEDNLQVQAGGIRLAPNVYDVYLSIDDHRRLSPNEADLIKEWRRELEKRARQYHYQLRTSPIIRLHGDSTLHRKIVHVVAEVKDAQHLGGASGSGISATQVFNVQAMPLPRPSSPDAGSPSFAYPGGSFPGGASAPVPPSKPQAWLTIRLPQGGQEIYRIEKPEINIGRQRSNDIIVEDKRVSRNHATIRYQNGQFTLFDRNSVNGIIYNGKRLDRQQTLRSGDYFTIGSYDFYFDERR